MTVRNLGKVPMKMHRLRNVVRLVKSKISMMYCFSVKEKCIFLMNELLFI